MGLWIRLWVAQLSTYVKVKVKVKLGKTSYGTVWENLGLYASCVRNVTVLSADFTVALRGYTFYLVPF